MCVLNGCPDRVHVSERDEGLGSELGEVMAVLFANAGCLLDCAEEAVESARRTLRMRRKVQERQERGRSRNRHLGYYSTHPFI